MKTKTISEITSVIPVPGEPMRYRVQSRTNLSMRYLVDLGEHGKNGWCGCDDFAFHCGPALRANLGKPGKGTRCHHIQVARDWFADTCLEKLKDHLKAETAPSRPTRSARDYQLR